MNNKELPDLSFAFLLGLVIGMLLMGVITLFIFFNVTNKLHVDIYSLQCEKFRGHMLENRNICIKDNQELRIK